MTYQEWTSDQKLKIDTICIPSLGRVDRTFLMTEIKIHIGLPTTKSERTFVVIFIECLKGPEEYYVLHLHGISRKANFKIIGLQ